MGRFTFSMDEGCGMCGNLTGKGENAEQGSPPELRYIVNKQTGKGASVQCCMQCCRKIDENAKAEAAAKKHEEEQARKRVAIVREPEPVAAVRPRFIRANSNANGKGNKRTVKKGRAK